MNRAIKFRAWEGKEMFPVRSVDFNADGSIQSIRPVLAKMSIENDVDFDFPIWSAENITLMQFTGLKDKNGIEIYEGDILCSPHFPANGSMHYLYHEIMWDEKYTGWKAVSINNPEGKEITAHGNPQLWVYMKNEKAAEVIGNIYEKETMPDSKEEVK